MLDQYINWMFDDVFGIDIGAQAKQCAHRFWLIDVHPLKCQSIFIGVKLETRKQTLFILWVLLACIWFNLKHATTSFFFSFSFAKQSFLKQSFLKQSFFCVWSLRNIISHFFHFVRVAFSLSLAYRSVKHTFRSLKHFQLLNLLIEGRKSCDFFHERQKTCSNMLLCYVLKFSTLLLPLQWSLASSCLLLLCPIESFLTLNPLANLSHFTLIHLFCFRSFILSDSTISQWQYHFLFYILWYVYQMLMLNIKVYTMRPLIRWSRLSCF